MRKISDSSGAKVTFSVRLPVWLATWLTEQPVPGSSLIILSLIAHNKLSPPKAGVPPVDDGQPVRKKRRAGRPEVFEHTPSTDQHGVFLTPEIDPDFRYWYRTTFYDDVAPTIETIREWLDTLPETDLRRVAFVDGDTEHVRRSMQSSMLPLFDVAPADRALVVFGFPEISVNEKAGPVVSGDPVTQSAAWKDKQKRYAHIRASDDFAAFLSGFSEDSPSTASDAIVAKYEVMRAK